MNLDEKYLLLTFQKLPEDCGSCKFCIKTDLKGNARCMITNKYVSTSWEDRHPRCPMLRWEIKITTSDGEYSDKEDKKLDEEKFLENYDNIRIMENIENLVNECVDNLNNKK